jgi:hypothetical protein
MLNGRRFEPCHVSLTQRVHGASGLTAGTNPASNLSSAAPRVRRRNPRRLLWLAPAVALAAILPYSNAGGLEFLAVISFAGLVRLPTDPRLAIACGLVWTAVGMSDGTSALAFTRTSRA